MKYMNCLGLQWMMWMFLAFPLMGGAVRIENLKVQQRWPWNGLVDITYSVQSNMIGPDDAPVEVMLEFQGYDRDLNRTVALKTLSGDGAGAPVKAGAVCRTTWNAGRDYPDFHSSAFGISVKATARRRLDFRRQRKEAYLVIDLSGGPNALFYPRRYSEVGPDLAGDACRTTELWLRRIPAGTFMMGSPADELGRSSDEKQHQVTLDEPFYMGIFEVTQKQWELVMGKAGPSVYKGADRPLENLEVDIFRGRINSSGEGWPECGYEVAKGTFLDKLRTRAGLLLDLPTEAQWEYACRAGTSTALNSGRNLTSVEVCPNLNEVARYLHNCSDGRGGYTEAHTRVGSYLPNRWGLYDMHGNVRERCLDVCPWDPDYRMMRGGTWRTTAGGCRSASRSADYPGWKDSDIGYRLICLPSRR